MVLELGEALTHLKSTEDPQKQVLFKKKTQTLNPEGRTPPFRRLTCLLVVLAAHPPNFSDPQSSTGCLACFAPRSHTVNASAHSFLFSTHLSKGLTSLFLPPTAPAGPPTLCPRLHFKDVLPPRPPTLFVSVKRDKETDSFLPTSAVISRNPALKSYGWPASDRCSSFPCSSSSSYKQ